MGRYNEWADGERFMEKLATIGLVERGRKGEWYITDKGLNALSVLRRLAADVEEDEPLLW